jgi:hypothetical protein
MTTIFDRPPSNHRAPLKHYRTLPRFRKCRAVPSPPPVDGVSGPHRVCSLSLPRSSKTSFQLCNVAEERSVHLLVVRYARRCGGSLLSCHLSARLWQHSGGGHKQLVVEAIGDAQNIRGPNEERDRQSERVSIKKRQKLLYFSIFQISPYPIRKLKN